jgi:pimeloyl-ACP methyl ester carboxylesterase
VVIADHAGAIRALARDRRYMDLDRVAMVGQSWGADFTTRALLLEPDLYRVGVAVSGGWWSDPGRRRAKATVFEQCAVLREGEPDVPSLDPLTGDLLVIHGTADLNMSGSSDLMWWLDRVIDAGKYVDLMILPDRSHDLLQTDEYVHGAVRRYLAQHLGSPR